MVLEKKKRYEQQDFIISFFEQFHDAHENLTEMCEILTKD